MIVAFLLLAATQGASTPETDFIESATEVRLTIGADGKARDCVVTKPSGAPALDAKVCPIMLNKARFEPKLDTDGKPIQSSFSTAIKWRLPREAPKP